ncbi:hypothetical protein [Aureimonas sp. AU4]|uniref:hypothetical protein n=1 Tax=Aureimonas sp. AU4 TaxID=1638163 RepID=UPI00078465CC|nr:hypothetical protein [Aureimonas sp. AU4]
MFRCGGPIVGGTAGWEETIARPATGAVAGVRHDARYRAKLRSGLISPPILVPYHGCVSGSRVRFGGRVVAADAEFGIVSDLDDTLVETRGGTSRNTCEPLR